MRPVSKIAASRDTILVTFDDLITAGADAKKTAQLLRGARSALRRVDALAAQALAQEDDVAADLAGVRTGLEQVVTRLAWRQSGEQRRARAGLRGG